MKISQFKDYNELPLFLNAEMAAKVLGVSPSSCYELMHEPSFPCLVVADRIPIDAIIGAPVVVTIGSSTVSYPLLRCNGAQVVAGNLRSRYRYSTVFSTNVAGGGAFRLLSAARRTLRPA